MESTPKIIDISEVGGQGKVRDILAGGLAILTENGEAVAIMVSPEVYDRMLTMLTDLHDGFAVDREAVLSEWKAQKERAAERWRRHSRYPLLGEEVVMILRIPSDRDRKVLELRFGLNDGRRRTSAEAGRELGLPPSTVSRIQARALQKLRHPIRSRRLRDYLGDEYELFSANPDMDPNYAALLDAIFFAKT